MDETKSERKLLPELPSSGNDLDPSGINKGFLIGFILTVGIGAINFGYSLGVCF